jgi:hypothetical protein
MTNEIDEMSDGSRGSVANHSAFPNSWIPVTERLPSDESQCIVWHKRSGECRIAFRYEGNWYEGSILITANVAYWMPLPAPPTDGK